MMTMMIVISMISLIPFLFIADIVVIFVVSAKNVIILFLCATTASVVKLPHAGALLDPRADAMSFVDDFRRFLLLIAGGGSRRGSGARPAPDGGTDAE